MTRAHREDLALRREALRARAALQRIQIGTALVQVRSGVASPRNIAGLALRLAGSWAVSKAGPGTGMRGVRARPWMLTAGLLLVRALRASPTVRWVAGAGAAGVAVWWIVQALRTPDAGDDGSG